MALTIIIIALAIILISFAVTYNNLIAVKNQADNAYASVDTMLKRRYDLIPNLVETVKQYMHYEQETLTRITELRANAISGKNPDAVAEANSQVSNLVSRVILASENYPVLQADVNFVQLQQSWVDVEENISAARRAYNAAVADYNNAFESFPGNIFAGMLKFSPRKMFEATEQERKNVFAGELFSK